MLIELYLLLIVIAFILTVLSFVPFGEKKEKKTETGDEGMPVDFIKETKSYVVLFPWLAMGLFLLLSAVSLDITVLNCATVTDTINYTVSNIDTISSSWTCNEQQYHDSTAGLLFMGLGLVMLVYSILSTFIFSTSIMIEQINRIRKD